MLDWTVNQLRYEEMLREAEERRRVRALLQDQPRSHTGISTLINRTFAATQHALAQRANVPQPSRMRSRKI
jgi:hypothetical protein